MYSDPKSSRLYVSHPRLKILIFDNNQGRASRVESCESIHEQRFSCFVLKEEILGDFKTEELVTTVHIAKQY